MDETVYEKLLQANEILADEGLRVLGIADGSVVAMTGDGVNDAPALTKRP